MHDDVIAMCFDPLMSGCHPVVRGEKASSTSFPTITPGRNTDQGAEKNKKRRYFAFLSPWSRRSGDGRVDGDEEDVRVGDESFK